MANIIASPFYRDILRECMTPELSVAWRNLADNHIAWENLTKAENNDEALRLMDERMALCKAEGKERAKSMKKFRSLYNNSIKQPGKAYDAMWAEYKIERMAAN
jgi:hypothetical protein